MVDRLIVDDARRRQGAFFTPDLWVAEAHKTLDGVLGPNWRDECIVWDPAAGTANLTRDYTFSDLIISTAEKPDVQVIKDQGYNPGAEVFQYDFLNPEQSSPFFEDDGSVNELPIAARARLKAAAKAGKRLVFLMNPPYGTANNAGAKGTSKAGIADTVVNGQMKTANLGRSCRQLYAQFMYQSSVLAVQYGFAKHTVALFSMPKFMSSGSFRPFRQWWYGRYEAKAAFMFQASHFADVSGAWGISFTVWDSPGKTHLTDTVPCTLKDEPKGTFAVEHVGQKAIYNSDGREASAWLMGGSGGCQTDSPKFSSGLKVSGDWKGAVGTETLGVFVHVANNIYKSGTGVFFLPGRPSGRMQGHSDLTPDNFRRALALYGARKLVKDHWTIHEDEYLVPAEGTPTYEQWVDDCHVFSLLDTKNNCTAMRDVQYANKPWTLHNHFFWRTHKDTLAALDTKDTPTLYKDCKANPSKDVFGNAVTSTPDPYMAAQLPSLNLSPEAQAVLDKLNALWLQSLPYRENYAAGKPDLHLTAWDAGLFQLKHLWRSLFPTEWADLQVAFKALADKLRPGVYEHGFLLR